MYFGNTYPYDPQKQLASSTLAALTCTVLCRDFDAKAERPDGKREAVCIFAVRDNTWMREFRLAELAWSLQVVGCAPHPSPDLHHKNFFFFFAPQN